jgi:hypothetical protein
VELGETFRLVANPDIGLTAHVAARGDAMPLAVVSLTSRELVVRSPAGAAGDVAFDYLVYGLRIGFEEFPIVQEKQSDAPVPPMTHGQASFEMDPELRRFSALARFRRMTEAEAGTKPENEVATADIDATRTPVPEIAALVAVTEAVEPGDVLVVDTFATGQVSMKRGDVAGDPAVIGVVASVDRAPGVEPGVVPVALAGIAPCKVDASYGAIGTGDLLAVSPTRGHAMRSVASVPGTIVGKALEPLLAGTGVIRVLVTLR